MRTLKFIVNKQRMRKDSKTDFANIVAGTIGYLEAEFETTNDWNGCSIVAYFSGNEREEYMPVINGRCMVPENVLGGPAFTVQLIGTKDNYRVVSTKEHVLQKVR